MTPTATLDKYAGDHTLPNGMPFRVFWRSLEEARAMNTAAGTTAYTAPGRVRVGWYYEDPDGDVHGPYNSSRRAWGTALGKPATWHSRPSRRKAR